MDIFHQYLDDCLLIYNNLFVFSDLEPSIISILYGLSGIYGYFGL